MADAECRDRAAESGSRTERRFTRARAEVSDGRVGVLCPVHTTVTSVRDAPDVAVATSPSNGAAGCTT